MFLSSTTPLPPPPPPQGALGAAASSLVLPAVAGGAVGALPHTLARALGAAPLRVDGAALRGLRLNSSLPALLLVRPPHGDRYRPHGRPTAAP